MLDQKKKQRIDLKGLTGFQHEFYSMNVAMQTKTKKKAKREI